MSDPVLSTPPPEIYLQMSIAAHACDQLEASGHRLHFTADTAAHRASAAIHDLAGRLLFNVAPTDVLRFAAGCEPTNPQDKLLDRQLAAGKPTPRKLH